MLAFEGDTGPYLQYAHARIRSIFRRGRVAAAGTGCGAAARRAPGTRWRCSCWASARRSRRRRTRTAPPSSAPTSSTWRTSFTTFYEACRVLVDDEAVRDLAPRAVPPHGPGAGAGPLAARAWRRPSRCEPRMTGLEQPLSSAPALGAGPRRLPSEPDRGVCERNGSERHVGHRHRRGVRARGGHLTPAGRAGRPGRRGRPPGGQGRAPGQGDRRALRPDRRHQRRAGRSPPWTPPSRWRRSSRW